MVTNMEHVHANLSTSISEFKKNPSALLAQADGETVALLNHNKPTAYIVPAKTYEMMLEAMENLELLDLAKSRLKEKGKAIRIKLEDL
jgi:antitoxin StbD